MPDGPSEGWSRSAVAKEDALAQRQSPRAVGIAAIALTLAAIVATFFLHGAPGRSDVPPPDPILFIGPSHAVLFGLAAWLATRRPRTASYLVVLGSITGPWAAILTSFGHPFQGPFLFLSLVGPLVAALLLAWPVVAVVGLMGIAAITALATFDGQDAAGLYLVSGILQFVITMLMAGARWSWDKDRAALANRESELKRAFQEVSESEHRFRLLGDAAQEAIAIHVDGVVRLCNPRMATMFGRDQDAMVGLRTADLVVPRDVPIVEEAIRTRRETPYRVTALHGDGTAFAVEVRSRNITFRGEAARVSVIRDLTKEMEAEQERLRSASREEQIAQLQQTIQFKSQFMDMTGHELKNPLTPIRLQVAMLRKRLAAVGNERDVASLDILERAVERLGALVNDVLDVGRMEADRFPIQPRPMDLQALVREESEGFVPVAMDKGIALTVQAAPVRVDADPVRLAQVLANFLGNAVRFAKGRIDVTLTTKDGRARLEVEDDGVGIDPARIGELFEPFIQVHDPGLGVGGTGLGLFICRGIVEAHGGTLGITSAGLGQGSMAWMELPVAASGS